MLEGSPKLSTIHQVLKVNEGKLYGGLFYQRLYPSPHYLHHLPGHKLIAGTFYH